MRTRIVRIGNSRGIRIPKPLLEEIGLEGEVEVKVEGNALVVRPVRQARAGWSDVFARMAERGDDELLDRVAEPVSSWDEEEWQWS
ncbi:MAG: AbrB/MazE/SpoVT family DNA-binding domain-containing protein [Thermoanaerobaculaceae bacterium]|jgi:antitoxin MazE|nr:AbrB/MazE/SpoVT family DNA-binding domain-containing protein [Thermoanaerobaculaceae bacterium]